MKLKKFQFPSTPAPVPDEDKLTDWQKRCRAAGSGELNGVRHRWCYFEERARNESEMIGDVKRYSDRARMLKAQGVLG